VENKSGQGINYLECLALVCDIKNNENCITIPLIYESSALMVPGAKMRLTINESAYQQAKQQIEKFIPIKNINTVDVTVGQVFYNTGAGWCNENSFAAQQDSGWGRKKTRNNAYLIPKDIYAWGNFRERGNAFSSISAGSGNSGSVGSSNGSVKGGNVYVRGYTRKDGTSVGGYTRSSPGRGGSRSSGGRKR
jgi:hypothetical protein